MVLIYYVGSTDYALLLFVVDHSSGDRDYHLSAKIINLNFERNQLNQIMFCLLIYPSIGDH